MAPPGGKEANSSAPSGYLFWMLVTGYFRERPKTRKSLRLGWFRSEDDLRFALYWFAWKVAFAICSEVP